MQSFDYPLYIDFRCSYTNTRGELDVYLTTEVIESEEELKQTVTYIKECIEGRKGTNISQVNYRKSHLEK